MKLFFAAAMTFVGVCAVSQAHDGTWEGMLVRAEHPGFVLPGTGMSQQCTISGDEVIIRRSINGVRITERHTIDVDGDFGAMVKAAANGKITSRIGPIDGPSTYYYTIDGVDENGDAYGRVDLGSDGDGAFTENDAPESVGLKRLIDAMCPANY